MSEITNMVGQMDPKISDQVIYSLIKQKKDANKTSNSQTIKLQTGGSSPTLEINPRADNKDNNSFISSETLEKNPYKSRINVKSNQSYDTIIRSELGRKSIPKNYEKHATEQIHILDDLFKYEQHMLVTKTDKGEPTKSENMWIVWPPIVYFIKWVIKDQNYGDFAD